MYREKSIMTPPFEYLKPLSTETYKSSGINNVANQYNKNDFTQKYNDNLKWYEVLFGCKEPLTKVMGDNARQISKNTDDTTALTIMLEDYAEECSFVSQHSSIKNEDMADAIFSNNIFRDDDLQKLYRNGIARSDLYDNAIVEYLYESYQRYGDGSFSDFVAQNETGMRYSDIEDSRFLAALNLAKADIGVIEKAYGLSRGDKSNINGLLSVDELRSSDGDSLADKNDAMKFFDIDDNDKVSAEEYAAFILALDENNDGVLSQSEVEYANNNYQNYTTAGTNEYEALHYYYDELAYYLNNN